MEVTDHTADADTMPPGVAAARTAGVPRRRWVLAVASTASLMCALDTLVVSTALTTIRVDLGASAEALEWTVNAYNHGAGYVGIEAVSALGYTVLGGRLGTVDLTRRAQRRLDQITGASFLGLAGSLASEQRP